MKDKTLLTVFIISLVSVTARPQGSKHLILHPAFATSVANTNEIKLAESDIHVNSKPLYNPTTSAYSPKFELRPGLLNGDGFNQNKGPIKQVEMNRLFSDQTKGYFRIEIKGENGQRFQFKTSLKITGIGGILKLSR